MRNIRLTNRLRHLLCMSVLVINAGCQACPPRPDREPRPVESPQQAEQRPVTYATGTPTPATPAVCTIGLNPAAGPIPQGGAPPLRVGVDTSPGCTVRLDGPPIVVPPGSFNGTCVQLPATPANSIAVTCPGVPAPANPPAAALGLTFKCQCPPGVGLGDNTVFATYLF